MMAIDEHLVSLIVNRCPPDTGLMIASDEFLSDEMGHALDNKAGCDAAPDFKSCTHISLLNIMTGPPIYSEVLVLQIICKI